MSAIPGVNRAYEEEQPSPYITHVNGAPWAPGWRALYPIDSDAIRNHDRPAAIGVFDGADNASEWNQYQGTIQSDPISMGTQLNIQQLGAAAYLNIMRIPDPEAIDQFDRHPDHGQMQLTGVDSIAAIVPFMEVPHSLPYHYDVGAQIDQSQAIGQRQVFRAPPTFSDQTAAVYAAGF